MYPSKENKMGVMPINKLIISMSLPMMLSMIVQALYNIVDSVFVAMVSENALTAVSLAFPVQNMMIAVASGTGVGINALLSKSLGEKHQDTADKAAVNGLFLILISYAIFLVFGLFCSELFFAVQTDIEEIVQMGREYLFVICVASFGLIGQVTGERLLQATGRTVLSMVTQVVGAVINIILDPIMIFGLFGMPKMGVFGAAVATVIGQICAFALAMFFNIKYNKEIHISFGRFRPDIKIIFRIYAVGIPSIIMIAISSVMTFGMNKILLAFSSTAAAVLGVYFKLQSFVFMPVFGLNNGMIPIVSYNYGAQNRKRMVKTIKLSLIYAVVIMFVGLAVMQIFPRQLLMIFNASGDMLKIGVPALRIISTSFIFAGFGIVTSSVFQALGKGISSMIISITRQLVVLLPAAYLLSKLGQVDYVWLAFPISEIVSVIICAVFLINIYKKVICKIGE